jgi:sugar O-acyltransferase (sialic acid O-acetyltransferase NeuD family)
VAGDPVTATEPTPLVVVGAGGLGRETIAAIGAANRVDPTWDLLGLLDDRPALIGQRIDGVDVLGPTSLLAPPSPAPIDRETVPWRDRALRVVLGVGSPRAPGSRAALAARLDPDIAYGSVVHPTASLAAGTVVGFGTILLAQVVTTAPVAIGRHVVAMPHVVFTHDDVIGDHTTFGAGAMLAGGVVVGAGAYVGSGALVRENITIGCGALVGMGAVVTRDVPPGEVWAGNPARPLHARRPHALSCGGRSA